MTTPSTNPETDTLRTLPGDDVRQIMWRFADRYDLQMLVQATRSVARGPVAHLVAEGVRNSHEWNAEKSSLLKAFDEAGVTTAAIDPKYGGYIEGPKNLALALVAFELSWVDGGAATCSLAGNLALAPIHERGTEEQKEKFFTGSVPLKPGEDRKLLRGAFALTEPLPYVGVETGLLSGKIRVAEWKEGQEPLLQVEKRGRFITNMGFANYVTAAVDTDDPRIKSSCMVILEETDPGTFDRGTPARKLVHQLSSTRDPVFNLKIPANRIIGGYTVKDGKIVPNFSHGEVIEAVFKRTRVTVGLMTTAKLLSAIEPLIRYHRNRFRGGTVASPGTPRYDLGIQQKEDAVQRTLDVWGMGEAGASLGFTTARLFDQLDPMERKKDELLAQRGVSGARAQYKLFGTLEKDVLEFIQLIAKPEAERDAKRYELLKNDTLVQYLYLDSLANVMCPACKLWNTGYGANAMREAVAMMGGYGITEDCPGFLGHKWTDIQLEATYEGPEAVQRRQMSITMTTPLFLAQYGFSPTELASRGLYWLMLIGVFLEAARLLDIGVASEFRHRVVAALPALLSASLVLAVGLIVIAFLSGFVRTVTRNAGSPYANLWSRIIRWVGVILVLSIAFEQADIRSSILAGILQIVVAAFAFGMALAFGLGCKDMARNAMEKMIADMKERHKDASKSDMEG